MYSKILQAYVRQIGEYAHVDPDSIGLLGKSLACLVTALGNAIGATAEPEGDLLDMSVRLLLLSDALARLSPGESLDGAHYLVALGLEQSSALMSRLAAMEATDLPEPVENDCWYALLLAYLHYLAGGYRVQAVSALRHLEEVSRLVGAPQLKREYTNALASLGMLRSARRTASPPPGGANVWYDLLFGMIEAETHQQVRIQRLARQICQRRDVVLANLGEGDEVRWLSRHGVDHTVAGFWGSYLASLDKRGITAFTQEQVGDGGDFPWLRSGSDLLVVLPTGSGKTVIGELRSALSLAQGRQALWMLPTRALVRQVTRELRGAFEQLGVTVEELPTTEDFLPLFAEDLGQRRHVAVTTPEKLASLVRSNPEAVTNVGAVVFDEAQTLLTEGRGTTAEFVLQHIRRAAPLSDLVLMTAFSDIKDSLERFLLRLGRQPDLLVSDTRPTRRVYGIITNDISDANQYPAVLLFPPGLQDEHGQTETPYRLVLSDPWPLGSTPHPVGIGSRFARATTRAGIRTAVFVSRLESAEVQAARIAKRGAQPVQLPKADVARLRVELGRSSVVEETSERGVSCHHAGLTPLEQNLVEKWLRDGIVKTVVATPTLAQGVNLPLDVSIVTYTTRRTRDRRREPVSHREILNMLGRSGRAGHVSDGFGLLCLTRSADSTALDVMDSSRRFFFHPQEPSSDHLGLSRLMRRALQARVGAKDWLVELGGLGLVESQTLVSFALGAIDRARDKDSLAEELRTFPSIQQMGEEEIRAAMLCVQELLGNIRHHVADQDPVLLQVLKRTGMPLEALRFFLEASRSVQLDTVSREQHMLWADEVVRAAVEACSSREWYGKLLEDMHLEKLGLAPVYSMIPPWRSGRPLAMLEANWGGDVLSERRNRISLGRFLNHGLSLMAQFWGALAVCREATIGANRDLLGLLLQQSAVFVREGVSSLEQLEWLRAIGSLDRVLGHQLAATEGLPMERQAIRSRVRHWKEGGDLPVELDVGSSTALRGALDLAR